MATFLFVETFIILGQYSLIFLTSTLEFLFILCAYEFQEELVWRWVKPRGPNLCVRMGVFGPEKSASVSIFPSHSLSVLKTTR